MHIIYNSGNEEKREVHDFCFFKEFSSTSNLIVTTPVTYVIYVNFNRFLTKQHQNAQLVEQTSVLLTVRYVKSDLKFSHLLDPFS